MDTIVEILLDCILSLVVDGGVEVITDSESCRRWPKGVRIALVMVTMAFFVALIGFLVVTGVSLISEGKIAVGVLLLVIALTLLVFSIIGFVKAYRKKKRTRTPIRVVAAVICDSFERKSRIFATARGYGEFKGRWEFPGGKIEAGETPSEAVEREIREELETTVRVGEMIDTIEYDYPTFHLSMDCFWCEVVQGELKLLEAEAARWLAKDELDSVNWLPADITLIDKIREEMGNASKEY